MTLSRNLALSATKISADGDIDYNNLLNKPTIPSVAGLASQTYVDTTVSTAVNTAVSNLVNGAPTALNTLKEIADQLAVDESATASIVTTLGGKQATLVSGTNIKTINGTSVLGSGDITISGGGGGGGTTTSKLTTGVGIATGYTGGLVNTLYESTRTSNNYFGSAVATTDQYIVVGVEAKSSNVGVVYVYSATTNALLYTLTNPLAAASRFGCSVSIYGNYIAVGALQATGTNANAGKVYYYDISTFAAYSGTPITVASANYVIADPNAYSTDSGDNFGAKVKITDNYLVATAPTEVSNSGYVYIFNRSNGTLLYTLSNPNPYSSGSNDYFGSDISIYGNTLVVGAYGEEATDGTNASGRAFVYNINSFPASPATIASPNLYGYTLENPSALKNNDGFGFSVAINGNYVAIGAHGDSPQLQYIPGTGTTTTWSYLGTVYVFNKTTGALVYQLNPEPLNNYIAFGYSISMNDTQLLVGTYYNASSSDNTYLYDLSTGKLAKIFANPTKESITESDSFGQYVALSNNKAVISAKNDNKNGIGSNLGAVHVFNPVNTFDGTNPLTLSLETTAVLPSQYGMVNGTILYIPKITVDKYGRVTKADQDTYYAPAAGVSSAFTNIVGATGSPLGAAGTDTIKFVGTGGTTVTVADVAGVKTVTINSVEGGASGGGATTVTSNIAQWMWDGSMNRFDINFNSSGDVTTFLANVGSNPVTISGFNSSMYMSGQTFTVTGTWTQTGAYQARVNMPMVSPSIPGSGDSGMDGTAAYSYTSGGASSNGASYFSIATSASSVISAPTPTGADGTKSVLMWVIPDQPSNSVSTISGGAWNAVTASNPISPSFSSLYINTSATGNPNVFLMNPPTGGGPIVFQWLMNEPLGMSSINNGSQTWPDSSGTISVDFNTSQIPMGYMITTRKTIYALVSSYGGAATALTTFVPATDIVAYAQPTTGYVMLKIPGSKWTSAVQGSGLINLGSYQGGGSMSTVSCAFFAIGS